MRKIFNHRFTDTIWSLGYWGTSVNPQVWIETRNQDSIHAFSLDASTLILGTIPQSKEQFKSLQWLTGLTDGAVFLRLRQGKNPGIEGLEVYDLPTGKLRYKTPLNQWTSIENQQLITNQGIIDLPTGNILDQVNLKNPASTISIESPMHFEESQSEFQAFATLFAQKFQEKIGKGMDYWEGSNKLIFSYYIYDNAWKNQLRICDYEFNTLFLETLAEGELMGYHTFQYVQNTLFFIKDKRELFIYADL
ncbi:MAG: hypothetical protein AABZ56_01200 [Bacteroidota bacterium]